MKITYIHHSAFFLETRDAALLFDYVKGDLPAFPAGKPLYVFVSHAHGDHYKPRVFDVADRAKKAGASGVKFILGKGIPPSDIPASLQKDSVILSPHEAWEDGLIRTETLLSNDEGVAFVLSVPDGKTVAPDTGKETADLKRIYYAGDLNAWNWDGEEADYELLHIYREELKRIESYVFDIAFIPLDPRLEENRLQGITDFFERCACDARMIIPMHCWERYDVIESAKEELSGKWYGSRFAGYAKPGDTLTF